MYLMCTGALLYRSFDGCDLQRSVGLLTENLKDPTEVSWRRLMRVGPMLQGMFLRGRRGVRWGVRPSLFLLQGT